MDSFVFDPPAQPSVAISNSTQRLPVHRIYCVGRNFAEHAKEMGAEISKGTPVFFMKPADAVTQSKHIPYPPATTDLHHEVELVIALGPGIPQDITHENAEQAIFAYGVGLDLTRRDLQAIAKEKRLPWDTSKGFDASAPISALVRKQEAGISAGTLYACYAPHARRASLSLFSDRTAGTCACFPIKRRHTRRAQLRRGCLLRRRDQRPLRLGQCGV